MVGVCEPLRATRSRAWSGGAARVYAFDASARVGACVAEKAQVNHLVLNCNQNTCLSMEKWRFLVDFLSIPRRHENHMNIEGCFCPGAADIKLTL